jgi:uncharacterized membrane protein (UPF0182 family)
MAQSPRRRPRIILTVIAAVVLFGLPLLTWFATVYTDYLWYIDLGQRSVFIVRLVSSLVIGCVFGAVAFLLVYVNARIARRMAPRAMLTSIGNMPPQVEEAILQVRSAVGPFLDKGLLWGSLLVGLIAGVSMAGNWVPLRLALASVPFGITDPQFGRDVGFYVFTLPALRIVSSWLIGMLIFTTIITAVIHLVDGAIRPWERLRGFAPHVKAHLSVLLGLIAFEKAFDYWLDIWALNLSPRGQVTGASYTDIHAQLPALEILIAIAVAVGIALVINIRFKGWRLPIISIGVWIVASVLVGSVYPSIVQQFVVRPNEVSLEAPYIKRNIQYTRLGFGLEGVVARPFSAAEDLTAKDIVADRPTLQNVRLWGPTIAQQSYSQLQSLRPYYDFRDVDIDRYMIDGVRRQVLISARELNTSQLAAQAKTWVNQHLVYTHGYGVVMSPVNEASPQGLPTFVIQNIPPVSSDPTLDVKQPALYFGEDTTDYVIVGTGIKEFDYPKGDTNAETTYSGTAGIKVGSVVRRLAWAFRLGTTQILFSSYVKPDSRVLFARDLVTRISRLAPWLVLDSDPYPAVIDGRVVWICDGYTASDYFPYSERLADGTNYVRNSVKITVDAYDGTVTLYAFDPTDPVLKAWRSVFPSLFADADTIPDAVRAHFRFPQGLFSVQAEVYRNYHMTDPIVFYNKEDSWDIPTSNSAATGEMEPFYVLMQLPGQTTEDFQMILPFTPRGKNNMIGWMAAKSDPADYGKRIVYQFPKQRLVLGPQQISARINQDAQISPQLSLWNQRGSQAIFGDMLVIPIKNSIVYVQPLYLQAETNAIPELTRVVVVYADKVEMEATLEAALLKVFGAEQPSTPSTPTTTPSATVLRARDLFEQAIAAQRAGDWSAYGKAIDELGTVLGELASQVTTPTK